LRRKAADLAKNHGLKQALQEAGNTYDQGSKAAATIDLELAHKAGQYGGKVSEAAVEGAEEAVIDTLEEDFEEETAPLKGQLKEYVLKAKKVAIHTLKEAGKAASYEGAWTASTLIPVVGPFVGMVRAVGELIHGYKSMLDTYRTYYGKVDPVYRAMFRVRDCMVDSFLVSNFSQVAAENAEASSELIDAALGYASQAAFTNEELQKRLHKKYAFRSADQQEALIMDRLQTGRSKTLGIDIPLNNDKDARLEADVMAPSNWTRLAGGHLDDLVGVAVSNEQAKRGLLGGGRKSFPMRRK